MRFRAITAIRKPRGAIIAAHQTVIVSDRRNRGPWQARFSLAGVRLPEPNDLIGEAHFAALCLRPSARDPPPIAPLLKTKAKVPFDRAVTERSRLLFCVFQPFNRAQFQPLFSRFHCPVGRGSQAVKAARRKFAAPQSVILNALILCTGADKALLQTRRYILEAAGHTVVTVTDEPTLLAACKKHAFDVAVIGQSTRSAIKQRIADLVREHCPNVKVLELYHPHLGRIVQDADSWLATPADVPRDLADRVNELANGDGRAA